MLQECFNDRNSVKIVFIIPMVAEQLGHPVHLLATAAFVFVVVIKKLEGHLRNGAELTITFCPLFSFLFLIMNVGRPLLFRVTAVSMSSWKRTGRWICLDGTKTRLGF